ncbi:AraC family transcriptional regulator [Streptomyces sp. NPDC020298]|uniref:AraC family transcriptional regulator n=1 Tax=unclassified Streptomyces TaxID=2593676 RepID=UPI0033E92112
MSLTPVSVHSLGFLHVSTVRGTAQSYAHDPGAATADPSLLLALCAAGRATLVRRGTAEPCGPGDLFLCEAAEPFTLRAPDDLTLHLVRIPRYALTLTGAQAGALGGRAPFAGGSVAPLLGSLVREVAGATEAYSPRTALHLAGTVAELVALLAVEDIDAGPRDRGEGRDSLVRQLRAHVDARLWDRELTPGTLATAQHISIRYLHKLFEDHGSTVGRWIQHRRLEEARRELARPGRGDTTVSAVARRWGFASATHFSRSFRAAYGVSPSAWRDARLGPTRGAGGTDG